MKKFLVLFLSIFLCSFINAQEICNNGIDDDSDGLIDLNDSVECVCTGFETLVSSLVPNPSFEVRNCCPSTFAQLSCAASWTQATNATADYLNTCGFVFPAATSLSLTPPPDGNGFAGIVVSNGYQEYIGSCLSSQLIAGTSYKFRMNIASSYIDNFGNYVGAGAAPPINLTVFGNTTCPGSPLATSGCPGGSWIPIAVQSYTPVNNWGLIEFTFTPPTNISAFMVGGPCTLPAGYNGSHYPYFYLDNLIINEASLFSSIQIAENGGLCSNNLALTATADSAGGSWEWYKNGIALTGQTTATLSISANSYGTGKYSARYTIGSTCDINSKIISTPVKPVVNFTLANTCLNSLSSFSSTSTASVGIATQSWNFGDGSSATGTSPSHLYGATGSYNVKLVVKDNNQCKDSLTKSIAIYPNPVISIGSNTVCFNTNTAFTNTSSIAAPDNISAWAWDFDNNGTTDNTTQSPVFLYGSSGAYTAELKATSNHSCRDSLTIPVLVRANPVGSFSMTNACLNTAVSVTNASSIPAPDNISTYAWQFGAGSLPITSTLTVPSPTYVTSGIRTITLTLTANTSCSATVTNTVNIYPQPVANFSVTPACESMASVFSDVSTPAGSMIDWKWDFTSDNMVDAFVQNPSHSYAAPGTYTASLIVTSNTNCKDTVMMVATVYKNPVISISSNTVCFNSTTTFTNTSSITAPDNITTWAWDFDNDGFVDDASQSPSTVYSSSGNYTAELKATSNHGCEDSLSIPVLVKAMPQPSFLVANACLNTKLNIINTSYISAPDVISSYSWQFDAAASPLTSSQVNPTPSYSTSGTHTITLSVMANVTCSASTTQTVTIYPQPVANFSTTSVCASSTSAFTDLSAPIGSMVDWEWDFNLDNGVDDIVQNPSHTFPAAGTYTASLIVTSNTNCKDTVLKTVNVYPHPVISFSADTVCFDKVTTFTNTSSIAAPDIITAWAWDFNTNGVVDNTNHSSTVIYGSPGTYTAQLKATSNHGCADSLRMPVLVRTLPVPSFVTSNACLNTTLTVTSTSSLTAPDYVASYGWKFDAAASTPTSSAAAPTPFYSTSGIHTITLTITANTTCSATAINTVNIYPQPVANFSVTSICESVASAFTDLSAPTGSIVGWQWDFNADHIIDHLSQNPFHTYAASGTFTASLIATSNTNCKDTIFLPVNVWGHALPNFTADSVCFGSPTTFTNATTITSQPNTGVVSSYKWDFADAGATSTVLNPNHTFTTATNADATYSVNLKVTTSHGCADSVKKPVYIYAIPSAAFTSDSVCLGSLTHLIDHSNGNGHTVNSYRWDFLSNGTVDAIGVPAPTFIFPSPGNNAITYSVTTMPIPGLTCHHTTSTLTAWVNPIPMADFIFVSKCINVQPLPLNASISSIAIGTNTLYSWQYGDGTVGAGLNAGHAYTTAGPYMVTLTVTSDKGCQATISKPVELYEKPHMAIVNSSACDQKAMTFTATTQPNSGTIINWFWDFNQSISTIESNGQTVNYILPAAGNQTVSLVSETDHWCRDTLKKTVYVDYLPVPSFTSDKQAGCSLPLCVEFTNTTLPIPGPGQTNGWKWYFGDGSVTTSSTSVAQTHCYTNSSSSQSANFPIKLIVSTDKGCVDSLTAPNFITVYPKPVANYEAIANPGNVVTPMVDFTNQSLNFTKWWLSFGDGPEIDSVHLNPTHYYENDDAETYHSILIVSNQYNCLDTAYLTVKITPDFVFYMPNAFSPQNGDGVNDVFSGKGIGIKTYEMWVFDHWGETIYHTEDIEKGWDGSIKNTSSLAKEDVYVWKVILRDVLGKPHEYVGRVTLLK